MKKFASLALLVGNIYALPVQGASYTFHLIAEASTTSSFSQVGTPSINDLDQVAFSAVPQGTNASVVVRGTTNLLQLVGPDGRDDFYMLGGGPKLTGSGLLVFQCATNDAWFDPPNIWISDIATTTLVVSGSSTDYPIPIDSLYGIASTPQTIFSFNAYTAALPCVKRFMNSTTAVIAGWSSSFVPDQLLGTDVRTNGIVTFYATGPSFEPLVIEGDGSNTWIRITTNHYASGMGDFASGGDDDLVVAGIHSSSFMNYIVSIDLYDGVSNVTVYAETNNFSPVLFTLSLNDQKSTLIARRPLFSMTTTEIMLSENGAPAQHIVQLGDPLFGGTIQGLRISRHSINNKGNFTFYAELDDLRRVIVLAKRKEDNPSVFTRIQHAGSGIQVAFTGEQMRAYVVQASTNLSTWTDITTITNLIAPGTNLFIDTSTPVPFRAYRLRHP